VLFAVSAPGLAEVVLSEVRALGLQASAEPAGVQVADDAQLMRLNLWLRSASRVLVRMGEPLRATAFPELVRKAAALPWERFVRRGTAVEFNVTCRKSRLYHSGAVRQRLHEALQQRLGFEVPLRDGGQLFVARFERDLCTMSADSSGALLHQRGWRGPSTKAPLRETLAAALLLAAGYDGSEPLCDPFCGSGTIAIEAALIAARRAPGMSREFAFMQWPGFDGADFEAVRRRARDGERTPPAAIEASDQDAGAVAAARENAARAGVQLSLAQRRVSSLPADGGAGLIACNPPYGVRIASGDALRELADALRRRPSWRAAVVVAGGARVPGAAARRILRTQNGGIGVEVLQLGPPLGGVGGVGSAEGAGIRKTRDR